MEITLLDKRSGKMVILKKDDIKPALKNLKNFIHLIREQLIETTKYHLDFITFDVALIGGQLVPTEEGPIKLTFKRKGAR
jgi:hypothetical protein